jgi:hypothetical protein
VDCEAVVRGDGLEFGQVEQDRSVLDFGEGCAVEDGPAFPGGVEPVA